MSYDCPEKYEVRRRAERDAEREFEVGGLRHHSGPYDCDEANDTYRSEFRREFNCLEDEDEERQAQARREEERQAQEEREYWDRMQWEEDRYLEEQAP